MGMCLARGSHPYTGVPGARASCSRKGYATCGNINVIWGEVLPARGLIHVIQEGLLLGHRHPRPFKLDVTILILLC